MILIYGVVRDVEARFHLTNDVYHMWTFTENNACVKLPDELASEIRLVPSMNIHLMLSKMVFLKLQVLCSRKS